MPKCHRTAVCGPYATAIATLNACIPGISALRRRRSQPLTEVLHRVGYRDRVDKLQALVAKLPWQTKTQWSAKPNRQIVIVHAISKQCLRMHRIGHVDALPPVAVDGTIND